MRLAPIKWPHDAKIAVSFFVAFEAFENIRSIAKAGINRIMRLSLTVNTAARRVSGASWMC